MVPHAINNLQNNFFSITQRKNLTFWLVEKHLRVLGAPNIENFLGPFSGPQTPGRLWLATRAPPISLRSQWAGLASLTALVRGRRFATPIFGALRRNSTLRVEIWGKIDFPLIYDIRCPSP